tara:strand:- start:383 stop:919 length:537 start_codon:yes stop_codon:yes gene_type:complete
MKKLKKKKPMKKTFKFSTPEDAKEKFYKKYEKEVKEEKNNAGSESQKKFYDTGNLIPECVNIGCKNAEAPRDWKYWSFHSECSRCSKARKNGEKLDGISFIKKNYCENKDGHLGFSCPLKKNIDFSQFSESFDIEHVDGDHNNNDPSNTRTYCKFCHNRISKVKGDWNSKKESGRKID